MPLYGGLVHHGQNGDELITGAGPGGGPHIRWFKVDVSTGAASGVGERFAYDETFAGGVFVTGRLASNVVTGAGPSGGPHVRSFSGSGQSGDGYYSEARGPQVPFRSPTLPL